MIDYFALLDQPRAPWLDLDELKEHYHQKTLLLHPDAQSNQPSGEANVMFANLNEAYQVLQDPKRRLLHLLTLAGAAPSSTNQIIPQQLQDLFPEVGGVTKRANVLLEKIRNASNRLSRSLLQPQVLELQNNAKEVRAKIRQLFDSSLVELRKINPAWEKNPLEQVATLSELHGRFAYLTRWSSQLDEIIFQLSMH